MISEKRKEFWHYRIRNELLQLLGCVAVVDIVLGLHYDAQHGLHAQQGEVKVGTSVHNAQDGLHAQQRQGERDPPHGLP